MVFCRLFFFFFFFFEVRRSKAWPLFPWTVRFFVWLCFPPFFVKRRPPHNLFAPPVLFLGRPLMIKIFQSPSPPRHPFPRCRKMLRRSSCRDPEPQKSRKWLCLQALPQSVFRFFFSPPPPPKVSVITLFLEAPFLSGRPSPILLPPRTSRSHGLFLEEPFFFYVEKWPPVQPFPFSNRPPCSPGYGLVGSLLPGGQLPFLTHRFFLHCFFFCYQN